MATATDVAKWMDAAVRSKGVLYQSDAASSIQKTFGSEFVKENDSGCTSIVRSVLTAFKKLNAADVVWNNSDKAWRKRASTDPKGRTSD